MKGGGEGKAIGGAAVPVDEGTTYGFGPLRATLTVIRTNYEVRSRYIAQGPPLTNPSAGSAHQEQD